MGPNFFFNAFENFTAMLNFKNVIYENFIQHSNEAFGRSVLFFRCSLAVQNNFFLHTKNDAMTSTGNKCVKLEASILL